MSQLCSLLLILNRGVTMNKDPKLQEILAHKLYLMNVKDKGYNDLVKKIIQNQIKNTDEYLTAYAKYKKKTGEFV